MGLFGRHRARSKAAAAVRDDRKEEVEATRAHLEDFVRTRVGVEAFVEPPTTVIPPTVVLIASDGEWTRRRVNDPHLIRGLSEHLQIPVYDIQRTGYPQRMRDYNERKKIEERRRRAP